MTICFTIGGHRICVTIPTLAPSLPKFIPTPPDPGPFLVAEGIDESAATSLQAIATMAAVTHLLPEKQIPAMQQTLQASAHALVSGLPGAELHMPWSAAASH